MPTVDRYNRQVCFFNQYLAEHFYQFPHIKLQKDEDFIFVSRDGAEWRKFSPLTNGDDAIVHIHRLNQLNQDVDIRTSSTWSSYTRIAKKGHFNDSTVHGSDGETTLQSLHWATYNYLTWNKNVPIPSESYQNPSSDEEIDTKLRYHFTQSNENISNSWSPSSSFQDTLEMLSLFLEKVRVDYGGVECRMISHADGFYGCEMEDRTSLHRFEPFLIEESSLQLAVCKAVLEGLRLLKFFNRKD